MSESNNFAAAWKAYEGIAPPERVREIRTMDWGDLRTEVMWQRPSFVAEMVKSLYAGDVYIIKQAFDPAFMKRIKDETFAYFQSKPSEFHKMLDGTPDFHRLIDPETGNKYSFRVCKHSAFFYPWNDDPLELFFTVNRRWRVIKTLMGLKPDEYERNNPKDGVVDRIQIAQYPSCIGFLEPHQDPYLHQRLFFSGYITKRGEDYNGGGFYLVGSGNDIVWAEDGIDVGDIGIGYATLYHGVAPCNRDKEPRWDLPEGRWFLSMYSNASDEVKDRHTGHPVKLDIPEVMP